MDEVVTSRAACCCHYGASDNFGLPDTGSRRAAAYSPQKVQVSQTLSLGRPEFVFGVFGARTSVQLDIVFS
jgi:hypothetical protein